MQQVGFRIRDEVFAKAKFQVGFNASKLENIYRDTFGEDMTMDAVKYPRYTLLQTCYMHLNIYWGCHGLDSVHCYFYEPFNTVPISPLIS